MDGLLLIAAEVLIIGVSFWVVIMEGKTPEEISRLLDPVPKPQKKPLMAAVAPAPQPATRSRRPGMRR